MSRSRPDGAETNDPAARPPAAEDCPCGQERPCCFAAPSLCSFCDDGWVPVGTLDDRLGDCLDGRVFAYPGRNGGMLTGGDIRDTARVADWSWQRPPSVSLIVVIGDTMASHAQDVGDFVYRGPAIYRLSLPGGGQVRSMVMPGYCGFGVGLEIPTGEESPLLAQDDEIGERLRRLARTRGVARGRLSQSLLLATEGIRALPFGGRMRDLFLEARSLDLLLALADWDEGEDPAVHAAPPPPGERAKLDAARDLLLGRLADPPGLHELARRVGLNTRKLKTGFRACFGTTVFGFVLTERMRQAYDLLLAGEPIQSVSYRVGYRSPKNFATAFRRRFGVVPSSVRTGSRSPLAEP